MTDSLHRSLFPLALAAVVGLALAPAEAQKGKKGDKKPTPKVVMAVPLGVTPGTTAKVTVRGLLLDKATEVRFQNKGVQAKILSKGGAPVPDNNPEEAGDKQIVVEVTVPKDAPGPALPFVVATPDGDTKEHALLIEPGLPVAAEKEGNDGFAAAQEVEVPQAVDGRIDRRQDVDVYAFAATQGQKLRIDVQAARSGSLLDGMLTVYGRNSQQLAFSDGADGRDPGLTFTAPADGTYYAVLIDAHDRGGDAHPYRLIVRRTDDR